MLPARMQAAPPDGRRRSLMRSFLRKDGAVLDVSVGAVHGEGEQAAFLARKVVGIPRMALADHIPIQHRALIVDIGEGAAAREGLFADVRHRGGKGDRLEIGRASCRERV